MLNSVVKISMLSAKYFEYYTIMLRGAVFSWTRCSMRKIVQVGSSDGISTSLE